ncbi:MAG: hypothetical protein HPY79_02605 [Bacteroidales bacterium]|nr:hypothetical protein [Bacteroidales bacterium]
MKFYIRIILKLLLVTTILNQFDKIQAQTWGIGASAIYNLQTESFGGGLRVEFPMGNFSIAPQVAYYPAFNKINEYYLGLSLHQNLFHIRSWTFYLLLHGGYNGWINYTISHMENAKYSNWDFEGGLGVKTNRCFRPFLEYRYNLKWKETNLQLGFMYFFNCKNNKRHFGGGGRRTRSGSCNAYD